MPGYGGEVLAGHPPAPSMQKIAARLKEVGLPDTYPGFAAWTAATVASMAGYVTFLAVALGTSGKLLVGGNSGDLAERGPDTSAAPPLPRSSLPTGLFVAGHIHVTTLEGVPIPGEGSWQTEPLAEVAPLCPPTGFTA